MYSCAGGLVLPWGADVTYGSGEKEEAYDMEESSPGDIVPNVLDAVPPARSEYAQVEVGGEVSVTLQGTVLKGTHWGHGVVLLERDAKRLREW